ncbi:MAG: 16S rRNA (cytidine(1402)-2'-O)-methyltransferase [Herbaspirillum sp.]
MTQSPDSTTLTPSLASFQHDLAQQTFPLSALYVVATPIGNTADISLRALHVLGLVDAVACEDTRDTAHLLTRYGLSKPLIAAHQHNEREVAQTIIARLQAGQRIALVSDAGTPAISDPGARIVDAILTAGLRVIPLPGASAAIAALSVGGLPNDHFYFVGFLPAKAGQRDAVLTQIRSISATLVLYEAPHRIIDTVAALIKLFESERQIVFAREISKLFEQIHRCALGAASAWLAADPNHQKGEFVLLIEGAPTNADANALETDHILQILLSSCTVSQAAALTAQITGQKKNALYQRALQLKPD